MNEKLKKVLKQRTTWAGIATIIISAFGLEALSAEQLTGIIVGLVGVIYPEKEKTK